MRLAIISDIHSNIQALTEVLKWCKANAIDDYVCLGDVIGYGADPNPCCELIREHCSVTLLGNHDAATIGVMDSEYYYDAAKRALFWTREELSAENFQWLYSLPYTHRRGELGFFHAAPIMPSGFYYVVRNEEAQAHVKSMDKLGSWTFVGHSHLTNAYEYKGKKVKDITGRTIELGEGKRFLINVGSVGQPRDRNPQSCFGVFDTSTQHFHHQRVPYDVEGAASKIRSVGLDEKFAKRLYVGI